MFWPWLPGVLLAFLGVLGTVIAVEVRVVPGRLGRALMWFGILFALAGFGGLGYVVLVAIRP